MKIYIRRSYLHFLQPVDAISVTKLKEMYLVQDKQMQYRAMQIYIDVHGLISFGEGNLKIWLKEIDELIKRNKNRITQYTKKGTVRKKWIKHIEYYEKLSKELAPNSIKFILE
jgi:hypothetical protein